MFPVVTVYLLLALTAVGHGQHGSGSAPEHWDYHNIGNWPYLTNSSCGETERQQSPIDLYGKQCDDPYKPHVTLNSDFWHVIVKNNGHTLVLEFDHNHTAVNGAHGPLTLHSDIEHREDDDYDLAEIHFHWSWDVRRGSEHAWQSRKFPAEVHLKFKHSSQRGVAFSVARLQEGALHAVGIALSDNCWDDEYDMVFPTFGLESYIPWVQQFGAVGLWIEARPLKALLDAALRNVYKYTGSLTTPPCTLGLPWLVAANPAMIDPQFLFALRLLTDHEGRYITRNYRDLQPHRDGLDLCFHEH